MRAAAEQEIGCPFCPAFAGFKVGSLQAGPSPVTFDQNNIGWQSHASLLKTLLLQRSYVDMDHC